MIKVIKSKEDYSDLGILMVNIDEKTIQRYFEIVGNHTDSNFYILSNDKGIFCLIGKAPYQEISYALKAHF